MSELQNFYKGFLEYSSNNLIINKNEILETVNNEFNAINKIKGWSIVNTILYLDPANIVEPLLLSGKFKIFPDYPFSWNIEVPKEFKEFFISEIEKLNDVIYNITEPDGSFIAPPDFNRKVKTNSNYHHIHLKLTEETNKKVMDIINNYLTSLIDEYEYTLKEKDKKVSKITNLIHRRSKEKI